MSLFGPIRLEDTLLPAKMACDKCRLCYSPHLRNPKIAPYGRGKKGIMVIGEAPGEEEDRTGKPWQGRAGSHLQKELKRMGIDLFEDCISYNSINCRPVSKQGYNREPTNNELAMCRNHVLRAIYKHKPAVILLLGGPAISSVIGARWTKGAVGTISRWRGWTIPDRELNTWIVPSFHPSYLMRLESKAADTVFRQDVKRALSVGKFPTWEWEEDQIIIVEDTDDLVSAVLAGAEQTQLPVAWDYETTGIKPYDKASHKIVSVAFSFGDKAYATAYPDMRVLKRILADSRIPKIAQHMKFESTWTYVMGGYKVRGLIWDTMLASHVLDNRPGITSLKFQAYVHFGLVGYDNEVEPYLKANKKDSNTVNRIEEAMQFMRRKVLIYNGIDSLMTHRLAMKQMSELGAYENGSEYASNYT